MSIIRNVIILLVSIVSGYGGYLFEMISNPNLSNTYLIFIFCFYTILTGFFFIAQALLQTSYKQKEHALNQPLFYLSCAFILVISPILLTLGILGNYNIKSSMLNEISKAEEALQTVSYDPKGVKQSLREFELSIVNYNELEDINKSIYYNMLHDQLFPLLANTNRLLESSGEQKISFSFALNIRLINKYLYLFLMTPFFCFILYSFIKSLRSNKKEEVNKYGFAN